MTADRRPGEGQEPLFEAPALDVDVRAPLRRSGQSIQEEFEEFHRLNPHVYDQLRALALNLVHHGRTHIGIGMLYEVLRWQRMVVTTGEDYKLDNNFRSRYARMLAANEPELADVFELRELQTA